MIFLYLLIIWPRKGPKSANFAPKMCPILLIPHANSFTMNLYELFFVKKMAMMLILYTDSTEKYLI